LNPALPDSARRRKYKNHQLQQAIRSQQQSFPAYPYRKLNKHAKHSKAKAVTLMFQEARMGKALQLGEYTLRTTSTVHQHNRKPSEPLQIEE
jgi:hypothetical protein